MKHLMLVWLALTFCLNASAGVTLPYIYGSNVPPSQANANDQALRDEINNHEALKNGHSTRLQDILGYGNTVATHSIDFNYSELFSARLENLSADPVCGSSQRGGIYFNYTSGAAMICDGSAWNSIGGSGGGGVSSVGLSVPSWLAVSGSPVTSSGSFTVSAATGQTANQFLATPNGSTGALAPRNIVSADIPTLNQNTTGSAGSLATTYTSGLPLFGTGSGTPGLGSITGNTAKVATSTGAITSGHCAQWDASGNIVDAGATCGAGGGGGISSVAMTVPSWLTVAGSPITSAGTLAVSATTGQTANQFLASPNGSTGAFGPRVIVGADLPNPSSSALGGIQSVTSGTGKVVDSISTSGVPSQKTITAGTNVTVTDSGGAITIASSATAASLAVVAKTTSFTLTNANDYVTGDASAGAFTLTLETAVGNSGKVHYLKRTDNTLANVIAIATTSAQTIDGYASSAIKLYTQNETLVVVSDGANWKIIEHKTVTPWISYTQTINAVTTNPTKGGSLTEMAQWRRVGDSMEVSYSYASTGTGSAGSGVYLYPLPGSVTIDTAKAAASGVGAGTGGSILGTANIGNSTAGSTATVDPGYVTAWNSTNLSVFYQNASTNMQVQASSNLSLGVSPLYFSFKAVVPIVGWTE